jgi:hypothetical protein
VVVFIAEEEMSKRRREDARKRLIENCSVVKKLSTIEFKKSVVPFRA